jgi:hypothetical protein
MSKRADLQKLSEPALSGQELPETVRPPATSDVRETRPSDTVRRDETFQYEAGSYASRIGEVRRLYASGEMDAALDLAATLRPSSTGFSLQSVPELVKTMDELRELPLDPRAAFLLMHVDGWTDLETVLDMAPLPHEESLAVFEHVLGLGVIRLLPPRGH